MSGADHDLQLRFAPPRDLHAGGMVRARLREALAVRLPPDVFDRLLLAATELVTNAVRHGSGDISFEIRCATDRLRVEVSDEGPGYDPNATPPGYGLIVVSRLSDSLGNLRDARHIAWFEMSW